ncbi:MAG: glycosyltransferase family 4 protein [Spongiibacteraceae bacterium]
MSSTTKKYTLAMVTPYPAHANHVRGGVESVAATLIKGLQELNLFDIHIVSPVSQSAVSIEERDGIHIHWVPSGKLPGVLRYWTTERQAIQQRLNEINPDITHFQGVTGWSIGYKRPYVVTIHGIAEKDALYTKAYFPKLRYLLISAVERFARKRAPHIISISPYVLSELQNQFSGQISNLENPVDGAFFDIPYEVEEKNILYVGRIIERKNIQGLINSFAVLAKSVKDAKLLLGGTADSPQFMNDCKNQAKQLGLSKRILFLGNINHNELPAKLATAKCLILLSHQETAPMAIEEAMAVGVPVVASKICGIPFMIDEGVTGYLVQPNNPLEAAAALAKILKDDQQAAIMSAQCRKTARNRFHYMYIAQKTAEIYFNILHKTKENHGSTLGKDM